MPLIDLKTTTNKNLIVGPFLHRKSVSGHIWAERA